MIAACARPARPQTTRRWASLVHFHNHKGRGARQMIANGNTVRSCDRNPLHKHYRNALRAAQEVPAIAIRIARAPRKLQSLIHRPISVKEITTTSKISPMRASSM